MHPPIFFTTYANLKPWLFQRICGLKGSCGSFFGAWQSRYPLPRLLDSLDASEQEVRQIEHHLDDRERCFAEMTAATVRDIGLFLLPLSSVPTTGRFVNIIHHFSTDVAWFSAGGRHIFAGGVSHRLKLPYPEARGRHIVAGGVNHRTQTPIPPRPEADTSLPVV
ncbi:hypothetical protein Q31b_30630 [Novipirellula aureliae]|uniref:Uncharacterized protein n=1 Tax=Novipirellula aureliae TaxID=2527966 RepID=A0A5C6DYE1_9BACT|nr:hypothetical protein Q31b_30630 [Novipirellula aureliae]